MSKGIKNVTLKLLSTSTLPINLCNNNDTSYLLQLFFNPKLKKKIENFIQANKLKSGRQFIVPSKNSKHSSCNLPIIINEKKPKFRKRYSCLSVIKDFSPKKDESIQVEENNLLSGDNQVKDYFKLRLHRVIRLKKQINSPNELNNDTTLCESKQIIPATDRFTNKISVSFRKKNNFEAPNQGVKNLFDNEFLRKKMIEKYIK